MAAPYVVTILLDVNSVQDVDDRAESRSYIVADRESGAAVLIDAILENVERDTGILNELNLTLAYALETHIHADHITGASEIKERTGAQIVYGGGVYGSVTGVDLFLSDGEELRIGKTVLRALATPGHTAGCTSYLVPGGVFTGDTLFIRGNGRTDLQGGSSEQLFDSVRSRLFALPDDTIVYPGHDYHGRVSSTIGEEKRFNERLNLSIDKAAFVAAMAQRRTALPARMDIAIPANMRAGRMAEAASDRQPTSR
ncbi:MAG TPA: MBL fold metallo-hydrolase [Nitrospira sp.]|jgi:sulfur dioxygenase|nr:MBL fold metallo-hydrolase [Nitrospira sp.]